MNMSKHQYICKLVEVVASKSECYKRKVGAIFVNDDSEILATGYNAPPRGYPHCDKLGPHHDLHSCGNPCTRNIHAELNAVTQAAKRGVALENSILYCNYLPCIECMKILINLKIKSIFVQIYNNDGGDSYLDSCSNIYIHKW